MNSIEEILCKCVEYNDLESVQKLLDEGLVVDLLPAYLFVSQHGIIAFNYFSIQVRIPHKLHFVAEQQLESLVWRNMWRCWNCF